MGATDHELLSRWAEARDAEAFKEVASRHAAMVYAVCRRILGDATEAEDVAQECFEALVQRGQAPGPYLGAWLHRVATNLALKRRRGEARRYAREARYAAEQPSHAGLRWDDLYRDVDEAVASLPEKLRLPVVLHFYESRTHEAIARELNVSRGTVTYRIGQGVERVRAFLRKRGVAASAGALAGLFAQHLPAEAAPQGLAATVGRLALAGATGTAHAGRLGLILGGLAVKKAAVIGAVIAAAVVFAVWDRVEPDSGPPSVPAAGAQANAEPSSPENADPAPETAAPAPPAAAPAVQATRLPAVEGRAYRLESGTAVSGLEVLLQAAEEGKGNDIETTTDAEGRFLFQGVREGVYVLTYRHRDGLPFPPSADMSEKVTTVRVSGPPSLQQVDLPIEMGLRVAGRVVDEEGRPVAEVNVEGRDRNDLRSLEVYTTGEDGAFELYGFKQTQAFTLEADRALDLVSDLYGPVALGPEGLDGVVLVVRPTCTFAGKVVDTTGAPLPDATVAASVGDPLRSGNRMQRLKGNYSGATGSDGSFSIGGLPAGSYNLRVSPGRAGGTAAKVRLPAPPWDRVELKPGEARKDAVLVVEALTAEELVASLRITGRVVDSKGQPVDDVEVMTYGGDGPLRNAWTRRDGLFELTGLPAGTYKLKAQERVAKHGGIVRLEGIEAGTEGLEIVLPALGAVEGRVVDAGTGEPVAAFEIRHEDDRNRHHTDKGFQSVQSPDGSFRLTSVEPGPVTVIARAAGYADSSAEGAVVAPGETARGVELRMRRGASVAGVVVNAEGQPVGNAAVVPGELPRHEHPDKVAVTRTAADGTFQLADLAGVETISAYHPDYAAGSAPVKLAQGRETNVRIVLTGGGVIEGAAYFDGKPWAGQEVRLDAGFSDGKWYFGGMGAVTSDEGTFRFEKVRPGNAVLMMFVPLKGEVPGARSRLQVRGVAVPDGKPVRVEFHFNSAETVIEGTVTVAGKPWDASVQAFVNILQPVPDEPDNRAASEQSTAKVQPDGTYRFEGVMPGPVKMQVWAPWIEGGFQLPEFEVGEGGAARQDIDLPPPPE